MLTDDPGTPDKGHWEINTAWLTERSPGANLDELPLLDINYGLEDRVQLKYEASRLRSQVAGRPRESGLSNSLVGVKWRFVDDDKTGWQISTYPQFEFRNPRSSSARRGLVEEENSLLLPVEIQKALGPVGINIEVGRLLHVHSDDSWIYGCALGRSVGRRMELAVELHGESDAGLGRGELAVNFGVRLHCTDHGTLLASIGREISNHDEPRASLLSYLGWQLTP